MDETSSVRYARLSILLLDYGRDVLLEILQQKMPSKILVNALDTNKKNLRKSLNFSQKNILYPKGGLFKEAYGELDFYLLCRILRYFLKDNPEHRTLLKNIKYLLDAKDSLFCNPKGIFIDPMIFETSWINSKNALIAMVSEGSPKHDLEEKIEELWKLPVESILVKQLQQDEKLSKEETYREECKKHLSEKSYKWIGGTKMFVQISELLLDVGSDTLRSVLYAKISPKELSEKLRYYRYYLLHVFRPYQIDMLHKWESTSKKYDEPPQCYSDFDFTLLYLLLRHLGNIPPHSDGWGKTPPAKDVSLSAHIDRLNILRYRLIYYKHGTDMSEDDFEGFKTNALSSVNAIKKLVPTDDNVQNKIDIIFGEETIMADVIQEISQQEIQEPGRSSSQPPSLAISGSYSSISGTFGNEPSSIPAYEKSSNKNELLKKFQDHHHGKLFKSFLGFSVDEPTEIFIVAYLKQTLTKSKYWGKFENSKVLFIDCMFVEPEAAEVMHSAKSLNNQIGLNDMQQIKSIITEKADSLMEKHSNLEMISASSVRSANKGQTISIQTCIVIYCRTKGIIPSGEEEFPKTIGGYPTDVREGLFQWAPGDSLFPSQNEYHNPLKMGCNIGLRGKLWRGSLGGFIDTEDGLGFLTCAHVLYSEDKLRNPGAIGDSDYVVQPADGELQDETEHDRVCGRVQKFVFDPNGPVGVDAALVLITDRKPDQGMFTGLSINKLTNAGFDCEKPLRYNNGKLRKLEADDMDRRVIKSGVTTGLTRGVFKFHGATVKVFDTELYLDPTASTRSYKMTGQLEIIGVGGEVFAQPGDSGSFVFLVEEDRSLTCIGMVEGWTTHYSAIVTPITEILQKLELDVTKLHDFLPFPDMDVD